VSEIWYDFCKKLTFDGHHPNSFASSQATEELLNGEVFKVILAPDSSRAVEIGYT
jgi:hypothetical protein